MSTYQVVIMTASNAEEASRIAEALVAEKLAACVNMIDAITSVYEWQGDIVKDGEVLMLAKARAEDFAAIEKRVGELHSYDVPEVIAVDLEALSAGYAGWLGDVLGEGS
jgi:periplasmic divalent cation tolerance protein